MKKRNVEILLKIKNNKTIRRLAKPFVNFSRKWELFKYGNSVQRKRINNFKDMFSGEECYIIGNGPSLTISDLELLHYNNKITFAANGIYSLLDKTVWRPTFYTCVDKEAFKLYGEVISNIHAKYLLLDITGRKYLKDKDNSNIFYFYLYGKFTNNRWESPNSTVSEDISAYVSDGRTVTFAAIQFAIYMGFKKIYLLGVDHSYANVIKQDGSVEKNDEKTYAEGIIDRGMGVQYVDVTNEAYLNAKEYCDLNDIRIYNATRGGKLEIFNRINLENTL